MSLRNLSQIYISDKRKQPKRQATTSLHSLAEKLYGTAVGSTPISRQQKTRQLYCQVLLQLGLIWAITGCTTTQLDADCFDSLVDVPPIDFLEFSVLITQLSEVPQTNAGRLAKLNELFATAGCRPMLTEHHFAAADLPNLICSRPGTVEDRIIIGAHFDKVDPGDGVADNWSGAILLTALYRSLSKTPRQNTFAFIAFSGEERGQLGSRAFVDSLDTDQRHQVRAMVNLDTLGLSATKVELHEADPELACLLAATATLTGEPLTIRNNGASDSSDHEPFLQARIPAIRLHSLTPNSMRVIHTGKDRFAAIDPAAYYSSYRLITAYLAVLDQY